MVTNPGNKTVTTGQLLSFTLSASDPDGNALTFASATLPTGATLNIGWGLLLDADGGSGQRYALLRDSHRDRQREPVVERLADLHHHGDGYSNHTPSHSGHRQSRRKPRWRRRHVRHRDGHGHGGDRPTYRFWLWNGSTWSVAREWGSNTFTWTPTAAGNYQLGVWVKPSSAAGDVWAAYGALPVTIAPATVSLAASPGGAVGTSVTATATATGVTSPTYRFWLWNGSTWSVAREWGSNTFTWTPTAAGNYQLGVWVKPSSAAGDVWAAYGALPVTIAPATVSLAASPGGAVGTSVTATATATGVTSPTYRFWLWNGSTWSVAREWGSNTFTWTPTAAGNYQLGVWVKPSSAAGDVWAAYGALPVTVTAGTSLPRHRDDND